MNDLITLEEVKMFCRIDDDFEDSLLTFLIQLSIDYLKSRLNIDEVFEDIKLQFKFCVLMLVNENYDNRNFYLSSNKQKVSMTENTLITSMLNEISYKVCLKKESEM